MSRTVTVTHPDGSVTTIRQRGFGCSGCGGCVTALAVVVVLFGPAAWFPGPWEVVAYIAEGLVVLVWALSKLGEHRHPQAP
jgi:hypothetical protein